MSIELNNESPESFIKSLPVAPIPRDTIEPGTDALPPTALLSELERKRLAELAATGQAPVERTFEKSTEITTFADGSVFKYVARPGSTDQKILVDATGQHIAIVKNEELADFLANACNLFVQAQMKCELEGTAMRMFHKPVIVPNPPAQ